MIAYNMFIDLSLFHEAYQAITLANEIQTLYPHVFNKSMDMIDNKILIDKIEQLRREIGIEEYVCLVDKHIINRNQDIKGEDFFTQLNEEGIEKHALQVLEALYLPPDRIENIKIDVKSLKYFYENRFCDSLVLLQNLEHTMHKETCYKNKPRWFIECQQCGQKTEESEDVDFLLNSIDMEKCIKK